jgi:hypothetical protein
MGHFTHNSTKKVRMARPCDILRAITQTEEVTMFIIIDCVWRQSGEAATGRETP